MSSADAGQAQRAAMSRGRERMHGSTGLRCDVITFYSGEVYNLYKYKKYTDVRLVFAPEFDIAFFGGDPDNFTYPRYDLDITFFRVYENDKPAQIEHYLRWSNDGVKENELIFVSGHPGFHRPPNDHGATRISARHGLPLAPGNLQAPHRAAAEFRQRVGRKCPHREGRNFQLPKLFQAITGIPGSLERQGDHGRQAGRRSQAGRLLSK